MTYGKRTLIAVDQLLNTLLGGRAEFQTHCLLKSKVYRLLPANQRAPRRLAGRNPVLALLPLGARRGESVAPQARGRAVLLAEGTLQEQL